MTSGRTVRWTLHASAWSVEESSLGRGTIVGVTGVIARIPGATAVAVVITVFVLALGLASDGRSTGQSSSTMVASRFSEDGNIVPNGFPSARTTGVPPAVRLTRRTGDMLIRRDGTVLTGLDLTGCIVVRANNVVITNSRVRCAGGSTSPFPIRLADGYVNLVIQDSEIDGLGRAPVAVLGNNWAGLRLNIHNSVDGPRLGSNTSLRLSYVHDLRRLPGTHNDALQTIGGNNIRVVENTLLAYNAVTDDPMNGAIQTGRLHSPLRGMLVEGNYMDGGSYTIRGGAGPRDGALISNYVFRNNVIGRNCGFGPIQGMEAPVSWEANNRWLDNGQVIQIDYRANKLRCNKTERSKALG